MDRDTKCDALASHLRAELHADASSDFRHNPTTGSVEIDLVHPRHGVRLVAFSHEFMDDNELDYIKEIIDTWGVVDALGDDDYLPVVITNQGPRRYQGR